MNKVLKLKNKQKKQNIPYFCFPQEMAEAMESEVEENFVDVPKRPTEVLELPIRVTKERPGNDRRSWADRFAGASHNEQPARSMYPSHLRSEVDSFDGVLPNTT